MQSENKAGPAKAAKYRVAKMAQLYVYVEQIAEEAVPYFIKA